MKKMRFVFAAALALAFTVSAAACSDNTGNTGGGSGGTGDTYQDYTPDKQPGDGQFDFDGNYQAPELTIDGLGNDEQWQGVDDLVTYGKQADGSDAVSVKVYRGESALFFLCRQYGRETTSLNSHSSFSLYLPHTSFDRLGLTFR